MWVVMNLHNEGIEAFKGLAFYDVNRRIWYKKMFNNKWMDENLEWFLRDGSLLIYNNTKSGLL